MIPYIAVAVAALAALSLVALLLGWRQADARLSPLAALALPLMLAGIVFGQDRLAGYTLIGSGLVLALIDIWHKRHMA